MENHADRIIYLDAVRGMAALFVVISHVIASHWHWMPEAKIALMLFNGNDAVSIFFVLSGLVLSHRLFKGGTAITPDYYKRFVVARLFRLYPAFLTMMVIYYLYLHHDTPFVELWRQTLFHNPHYFWEEAALMRGHHDHFFPGWTLGVEVAMSLMVPFMVLIAKQSAHLLLYLIVASIVAGKFYASEFILHFGLGILIAQHFNQVQQYNSNSKWYKNRTVLFAGLFLGYMAFHYWLTYNLPSSIQYFMDSLLYVSEFLFSGIIAALILLFIINSKKLKQLFSQPMFNFLGRISYGVYLSHWLFTTYAMRNFDSLKQRFAGGDELLFFFEFLAMTILLSIAAGLLLHYWVEKPFIKWGKNVAIRMVKNN